MQAEAKSAGEIHEKLNSYTSDSFYTQVTPRLGARVHTHIKLSTTTLGLSLLGLGFKHYELRKDRHDVDPVVVSPSRSCSISPASPTSIAATMRLLIYGLLLVLTARFRPQGLAGVFRFQ